METNVEKLAQGVLEGDRLLTGRAITLLESKKQQHVKLAAQLLTKISTDAGKSIRIGISGTPGVGKSTFIEAFGMELIRRGHKVAVLAIDPSSPITGGSIMGDKTRMVELSAHASSFIRPSPSSGTLGGVARKTREVSLILEASGYDIIIIETVGVGQSEVVCASMVDVFLMLQLPNAGDELQGIKKGILELADIVCINKSDGDYLPAAKRTKVELTNALGLVRHENLPRILNISALKEVGIDETADSIFEFIENQKKSNLFSEKRKNQARKWFKDEVGYQFEDFLKSNKKLHKKYSDLEAQVEAGELPASVAAHNLGESIFN